MHSPSQPRLAGQHIVISLTNFGSRRGLRRLTVLVPLFIVAAIPGAVVAQTDEPRPQPIVNGGGPLHPGDQVRLKIWREPDLSGDFDVDQSGTAVFPKVGPMSLTGLSPDSLKGILVASYSRFLRDPAIEIKVLRRVTVQGAVKNPGLYPMDGTMTIGDAVALAGGATSDGKVDRVQLLREDRKVMVDLDRSTRLAATPIQSGDQLFVPQKSWASRNTGVVAAGISAVATLAVALLVR